MLVVAAVPASAGTSHRSVGVAYTLLRSAPSSWVVGTAYQGWSYEEKARDRSYAWARIGGDLHACLWIFRSRKAGTNGRDVSGECGPAHKWDHQEFVSTFTDGRTWSNRRGNDGLPAILRPHGDCAAPNGEVDGWGNVQPWRTRSAPSQPLKGYLKVGLDGASKTGSSQVLVRYASKDGKYVMVHATRYGKNDGKGRQNWFFVQASCLQLPS
jgi:hypothetical protein